MFRRLIAGVAGALLVASLTAVIPASAVPGDAPADGPVQIQEQVLTWTASKSIAQYTAAPTTAKAGVTKIIWENSTRTGNDEFTSHTLTFDKSTPGYNHDVNLNILANPIDPNQGYYETTVTLTPGKYRYYCEIQGHQQMVGELTVVPDGPDETPPTVSANVTGNKDTNGNYVGKATVAVNASDAGSGVDKVEYQIRDLSWQTYTAPFDITTPGDYSVQYRATDKAGNVSPEGSVQFKVVDPPQDSTPPTVSHEVTGTRDTNGNYIGKATVAITATDAESGVDKTEYKLDSGPWTVYTTPVEVSALGMHMLSYRASDKRGNLSPEGMAHFTVVAPPDPDTTPPTVTAAVAGDKDPNGNYISKATVTITATDAGSGVKTTEYSLDNGAWTAYTTPVEVTALGAHTIRHRATDNANNTSPEGSTSFTVVAPPDTTPPTVDSVITGNKDPNGNFIESALVTISATDTQSGVKTIEYQLDSGAWTAYTQAFSVTARGAHMVHYRATDNANNTSPTGMKNFTVVDPPNPDTTPPTVTSAVSGDKDPNGNYIGSATVTLTATDTESGVDRVEYSLDGAAFTRYSTPVRVTATGAHTVRYRATDVAGNTSAEGTASFTIVQAQPDTTPPLVSTAVSGNKDPNGNYIDSATVTVTATDNQSGVQTTEYSVDNGAWTAYSTPVRVGTSGQHTVRARATDVAGNVSTPVSVTFTVVESGADDCPESDTRATVIIDGDDTRVANADAGRGCTINDLINETGSYPDHAAFVRHVEQVTDSLVTASLINARQQGTIVRAAARSDIGK